MRLYEFDDGHETETKTKVFPIGSDGELDPATFKTGMSKFIEFVVAKLNATRENAYKVLRHGCVPVVKMDEFLKKLEVDTNKLNALANELNNLNEMSMSDRAAKLSRINKIYVPLESVRHTIAIFARGLRDRGNKIQPKYSAYADFVKKLYKQCVEIHNAINRVVNQLEAAGASKPDDKEDELAKKETPNSSVPA